MTISSVFRRRSGKRGLVRWMWTFSAAVAILFIAFIVFATFVAFRDGRVVDFLSYWAAARMALAGHAALAYDFNAHHSVEESVKQMGGGKLPFPYPPPFLFFVIPFGLMRFWLSLAVWIVATGAFYLIAFRGVARLPFSLAHPAALINGLIGQNGFLTSGIFISGLALLEQRPFAGGAVLGLLLIKPQLALLLPVAVVAGRYWTALAGAAVSSTVLLLSALLIFGSASYAGFLGTIPEYRFYLDSGQFPWAKLASVFAFCRFFGIQQALAYAIHWLVALAAGALTVRAWWVNSNNKAEILAAATLLIPPYVWPYDSLLLMVPAGYLIRTNQGQWAVVLLWLLCLMPVISYFGAYSGPNTVPLAELFALYLMHKYANPDRSSFANPEAIAAGPTNIARVTSFGS